MILAAVARRLGIPIDVRPWPEPMRIPTPPAAAQDVIRLETSDDGLEARWHIGKPQS